MRLVFLDTETTGLDPQKHEIATLAFLVADEHDGVLSPIGQFNGSLRCTGANADPDALRVNGLSLDTLRTGPLPEVMLGALSCYGDAVIVGHNVLFDFEFLREAYRRTGLRMPSWKYKVCTMSLATALRSAGRIDPLSLSLDGLATYFGLTPRQGLIHDAFEDVMITVELYTQLVGVLRNGDRYVSA